VISEWFMNMAAGFVEWLASLFGEWEPPTQLTDMADSAGYLVGQFASLGVWVNWPVLIGCVAASVAVWTVVVGIKLLRAVVAHLPEWGGAGD
jgi:hypothetical protein